MFNEKGASSTGQYNTSTDIKVMVMADGREATYEDTVTVDGKEMPSLVIGSKSPAGPLVVTYVVNENGTLMYHSQGSLFKRP